MVITTFKCIFASIASDSMGFHSKCYSIIRSFLSSHCSMECFFYVSSNERTNGERMISGFRPYCISTKMKKNIENQLQLSKKGKITSACVVSYYFHPSMSQFQFEQITSILLFEQRHAEASICHRHPTQIT